MPDRLQTPVRVLYLGMRGAFSLPPLLALIEAGATVCAVLVPGDPHMPITPLRPVSSPSLLPIINPHLTRSIVQAAWEHNIPVFEVGRLNEPQTLATITTLQPDLGIVACWERRVPPALLALPRLGVFNVHPSLLPAFRGPAPLFWTLRAGSRATGVTIHMMDEGLDTGPIVAQAPLTLPDGVSSHEADTILAAHGGELLVAALAAAKNDPLPTRPQTGTPSAAPWPSDNDFQLDRGWSAQHAFNFMRGTNEWQRPYPLVIDGETLLLHEALGYDSTATLHVPIAHSDSTMYVQFTPGVLHVR